MPTVGICEDDDALRGIVRTALEREGYDVRATASGTEAVRAFSQAPADALVLDIGLPDADGRDVCQALRARGVTTPILFLTARDALGDRLSGFRAGGDDYLSKPFALAELVVRIDALIRRAESATQTPDGSAELGSLLDPANHGITTAGGTVDLTPTEYRLLAALAAKPGAVVRRPALIQSGWPDGAIVADNTLDAYVSRIRTKLREAGREEQIANVRGVGYRLQ
jgi:two-component system response regulator MprA